MPVGCQGSQHGLCCILRPFFVLGKHLLVPYRGVHCNSARRLNDRPSGGEVVTNHFCQAARWECIYSPTGQQLQDHFGGHDILTTVTINNHTSISHCLDNRTLPSVFTQAFQRLLGSSCCQLDDHDMLKPVHPTHARTHARTHTK